MIYLLGVIPKRCQPLVALLLIYEPVCEFGVNRGFFPLSRLHTINRHSLQLAVTDSQGRHKRRQLGGLGLFPVLTRRVQIFRSIVADSAVFMFDVVFCLISVHHAPHNVVGKDFVIVDTNANTVDHPTACGFKP